jgi:pimeloyl-ACP methyl ester carboxylesterase
MMRHKMFILNVIAILLILTACTAQQMTVSRTATPIPATPALEGYVDLGGYRLVYECYGEGSPAVIVEAGGGDKPVVSYTWKPVIQGVYNTTRICIYNRAEVHTSEEAAHDLHDLLYAIPVQGPYVIVAHSLGGWNARVFTHLYPEDVAGLILVDTTGLHEDALKIYATAFPTYSPDEAAAVTTDRSFWLTATPPGTFGPMDLITSAEQVRQAGSLGDLPLIVITNNSDPEDVWAQQYPWMDQDDAERFTAAALRHQAGLAALSTRGELIIANTSHHYISLNDPQTVIDAITRMVEEIRIH